MHTLQSLFSSLALFALFTPTPALFQEPINQPPVIFATHTSNYACQGSFTVIPLDASAVYDPEGDPLTFQWVSGCPGQVIGNELAPVTTLRVDTSASCAVDCSVRLRVSDGVNTAYGRFFIHISGPIPAELDMLPGACPNSVQINTCGVVTAALVGSLNFDVHQVDRSTLRLARADGQGLTLAPCYFALNDVAVPFPDNGCNCHCLTHDGVLDLAIVFNKHQLVSGLLLSHQPNASYLPVVLTGRMLTGEDFVARDCIWVLTH